MLAVSFKQLRASSTDLTGTQNLPKIGDDKRSHCFSLYLVNVQGHGKYIYIIFRAKLCTMSWKH